MFGRICKLRKTLKILHSSVSPFLATKFGFVRSTNFQVLPLQKNFSLHSHLKFGQGGTDDYCYRTLEIPEESLETCDLENGMRVINECTESDIVAIGCILPAGSMHETPEERGSALFMEHLIFSRTACRSQEELVEDLEKIGGKLNAIAMRDMFLFYGTVSVDQVDKLVELIVDVILNGITCEEDLIRERCNILHRLQKMETDTEAVIMDYLVNIAYQDTDLGKSIYPETCVIKNMSLEDLESFRERLFCPELMTLICTGNISMQQLQELLCKHFNAQDSNFPLNLGECSLKTPRRPPRFRYSGADMRLRDDDEEFGFAAIAMEGPGYANEEDHAALTVAKELIGSWNLASPGGMHNAPYLAHLAFDSDLCRLYKSFNINWANTSLWGVYFVCDKMQLEVMTHKVESEWMKLCISVLEKEVSRAASQCRTRLLLDNDTSEKRFFDIATCLYNRGRYEPLCHRISRFEKMDADVIRRVAMKYIYDQCPSVVGYGRIENLPDYSRIRHLLYLLRY